MNLKIFNLNCWLLPGISKHNNKRLKLIIKTIKKIDPDIVALQEVWLNKHVKIIESELKEYSFIKSKSRVFNKTGLLTGVKIKKQKHKIKSFPITNKHSFIERIAKKGFHIIQISQNLFFVNTQLYAPTNIKEKSITFEQFNCIQKEIMDKKIILVGDLNIIKKDLIKLNKIFNCDCDDENTLSINNPYVVESNKKVDYVLLTKNNNLNISTKTLTNPILSDHYFILASIMPNA